MSEKNPIADDLESLLKTLSPEDRIMVLICGRNIRETITPSEDVKASPPSDNIFQVLRAQKLTSLSANIDHYLTQKGIEHRFQQDFGLITAEMSAQQIYELANHPDVYFIERNREIHA